MNIFNKKDERMWFAFPSTAGDERYYLRYTELELIREINNDEKILQHILIDWEGVNGDGDVKLECNEANKRAFYKTRDGKIRLEWMLKIVIDPKAFETDENILKNLQAPFAGVTSIPKPAQNGATNANKVAA